ncbi:MAG: hypothetical protein ACRC7S_11035 [Cetobacterium sp.]
MKSFLQQRFITGETGERLNGLVNTQAYSEAVKSAENLTITSIGSLRAVPKFLKKGMIEITEPIIEVIKFHFKMSLLISERNIYTYDHVTGGINARVEHSVLKPTVFNVFENFVAIGNLNYVKIFAVNKDSGALGTVDFFSQIKKPVRNRLDLKIGIYRWTTIKEYNYIDNVYEDKKQIVKIGKFDDLESVGTDASGKLIVSGIKDVKRLYFITSSSLTREIFDDADFVEGDTILNFEQGKIDDLYINSQNVEFTGLTTDAKGNSYATTVNKFNIKMGKTTRGLVIDLNDKTVKDLIVYQNRLCCITDSEIFFSERFDYLNFLNGTEISDAFYIKPSPIRSTQPSLRRLVANRGLWINTDKGYYALGFNSDFSAVDSFVEIVNDRVPSMEHLLLDETLFFIDTMGNLYSVFNVGENVTKFQTLEVDKFDIDRNFFNISSLIIDGVEHIAVQDKTKDKKLYLYRKTSEAFFSRTTMLLDNNSRFLGDGYNFFQNNTYHKFTTKFVDKVKVSVHPPNVYTKERGLFLNNTYVNIKQVVLKLLNEDNTAVKSVKINGIPLDLLMKDDYSLYIVNTSFRVSRGFDIEILTNGNESILEILALEIFFE